MQKRNNKLERKNERVTNMPVMYINHKINHLINHILYIKTNILLSSTIFPIWCILGCMLLFINCNRKKVKPETVIQIHLQCNLIIQIYIL